MANKKTKATLTPGLAVAVTDNVPSVLDALNAEIASLKHIQETQYKTTGLPGMDFGNIKEEKVLDNLYRLASALVGKKHFYEKGMEWLGINTYPPFRWSGYSIEEWRDDILLRIAVLEHKDRLDKLNEFKDKMSKFLSEEDQKAILFKEMQAFLVSTTRSV